MRKPNALLYILFYIHRYDYMVPAMLNDGKTRRWSVADTFILVHK
jgi:hypothetical protein